MNTCDKCKKKEVSGELIWLTADDFKPKKGEYVPSYIYKKYEALCKPCYFEVIEN